MIHITLKGGEVREFESGVTPAEVAKSIGMGLYKSACIAKVNGQACDLRTPITEDCELEILTFDAPEGKRAFWHTAAHLLAQAVMHLYPETKFTIGPAVENGFYYDFDVEKPFTQEDLEAIEKEMIRLVKTGEELQRFETSVEEAKELMKDQPYKLELIEKGARRLGISCLTPQLADGRENRPEWNGAFDVVLCDVPCSGLGVIRKKPEIRYKDPAALSGLPEVQRAILENACRYVRPGGTLLYSTCTILPEENEGVTTDFLAAHPEFEPQPFALHPGWEAPEGHLTLWPQRHGTDGFYICKMRKR